MLSTIILLSLSLLFSTSLSYKNERVTSTQFHHKCMSIRMNAKDGKIIKPSSGGGFGAKAKKDAVVIESAGSGSRLQPGKGKLSPKSLVPSEILRPDYALDGKPKVTKRGLPWNIVPQTLEDIARMRVAGKLAREVLDAAIRSVRPGMTTDEIDKLVHKETIARNAYPSPLNYHGFPKSCCTSLNEVICHGIPDSTVLEEGDILNIDVTVFYDGVHGDCSETVFVGSMQSASAAVQDLVLTTYNSLKAAINHCKPGVPYNELGGIIENITLPKGYSSVKQFCGHGVGRLFHTYPNVLHYTNSDRSGIMEVGHTFTIEPMICLGSNTPVTWPDKWTAVTEDGLPSAQFEHTLLITENGVEELTGKLPSSPKFSWEV